MREKLFTLFLITLLIFTASCNKEDNPVSPENDIVGTWVLTKLILPDYGNMEINPQQAGISVTFKMKSDHTFEATFTDSEGSETDTGTWSVSNGKITMKSNSGETQTFDYEISGNKLRITLQMDLSEFGMPGVNTRVIMEFTKQ
ncbi:MAG: lipocalin family protein [Melioribacteraceae bacterium]